MTAEERQELLEAISFVRMLAQYGCAGVDQEPNNLQLCGKCTACAAGAWLRRYDQKHEQSVEPGMCGVVFELPNGRTGRCTREQGHTFAHGRFSKNRNTPLE